MDEYNQETITLEKEPISVFGIPFRNVFLEQEPCDGLSF